MQKSHKKCGLENNYCKYMYEIWGHKGQTISEIQVMFKPQTRWHQFEMYVHNCGGREKKSIEVLQLFKVITLINIVFYNLTTLLTVWLSWKSTGCKKKMIHGISHCYVPNDVPAEVKCTEYEWKVWMESSSSSGSFRNHIQREWLCNNLLGCVRDEKTPMEDIRTSAFVSIFDLKFIL